MSAFPRVLSYQSSSLGSKFVVIWGFDYQEMRGNALFHKVLRVLTKYLTELFKIIAMQMLDVALTESSVDKILRSKLFGENSYWYSFCDPQLVKQILNQLKAAGLLYSSWSKDKSTLFWGLTKKGVLTRDQMMLIKKS